MCQSCWINEYGESKDLPENWEEVADAMRLVLTHPEGELGGPLHVQLEDFNIEGDWTPWQPIGAAARPYPDDLFNLCLEVQRLVKPLTIPQRAAVLARVEGWF